MWVSLHAFQVEGCSNSVVDSRALVLVYFPLIELKTSRWKFDPVRAASERNLLVVVRWGLGGGGCIVSFAPPLSPTLFLDQNRGRDGESHQNGRNAPPQARAVFEQMWVGVGDWKPFL